MRFSFVLAVVAALAVSISATEEATCPIVCIYDKDCAGCGPAHRSDQYAMHAWWAVGLSI
ncbi:hypothetical protein CY34DRAFT_806643 [Suillus luteus UH-Slu-Lm8-n1]|uniref:Uncharacterized protein n=1 Tax=Suillus luteus UH-Slu-Lm8-n1 TaxID=930992 RepID=A0A0C9ZT17_9AGAM|nr:hypothetical protein CY34DRAFT_806643 [Suillus luteus UH-Slu-Lm8-n1]